MSVHESICLLLTGIIATAVVGCASPGGEVVSTTDLPDKTCPQCRIVHYSWVGHEKYHDVQHEADVMECPCCHSANANLQRGIHGPTCDICGPQLQRCPLCRGEQ